MSLDYNFRIATELEPERVLAVVFHSLELRLDTGASGEEVEGRGFLLTASAVAPKSREMVEEALGFSPSVDLQFWLDDSERRVAMAAMLRGVLAVLHQVPGDATLLCGGDTVLLLRREGQLILDSGTGAWTPERLASVDALYEMRQLPSL
ncbi:SitI3 family protein [Myxococcus eversor]|uniref:SitI3 family protein n=1 Tax=Myxococcus eversor TaxID=2709661 RepID=UPI0013D67C30|nr:SitI3 family protein [Myxococcus eversor]